ncbi:MAG: T9SS type A sorting domain-containing protein [Williamsia sp.]|nr:T9SS type A sorting domain-containing protein [Williamsia sp.]
MNPPLSLPGADNTSALFDGDEKKVQPPASVSYPLLGGAGGGAARKCLGDAFTWFVPSTAHNNFISISLPKPPNKAYMRKTLLTNLLHASSLLVTKAAALALCFLLYVQSSFAQQWSTLGNENQVSSVAASYTSIVVIDSVPYVVYREGTAGKVKKQNPATGAWEQVGDNIGTNVTYTRLFSDRNDSLYITYVDAANGNKLAVEMYNAGTNTWEPVGSNANLYVSAGQVTNGVTQYSSTPRCSMSFDSNNIPYIAFGDGAGLTPYVKMFDGTAWVNVGSGAVNGADTAVAVSLVIDEADVPWLVFCDLSSATSTTGRMALYQFTGNSWAPIVNTISGIRHTSMGRNAAGNLVIAYFNTGNTNRATVITYDKTANTFSATTALSSRDAPNLSMISDAANNLYCSFIDFVASTARLVARVFKLSAGTATWKELKDQSVTTGIDEPVGNLMIAVGGDTARPYIVYTKTNTGNITTPVVRAFIPPAAPVGITTRAISNFTATAVTAGGTIATDGGLAVTERGVVYGSGENPTVSNTKVTAAGTGLGSYGVSLTGLTPATLYYVRAYAINSGGITYGSNVRFVTPYNPDPVLTTAKQMEKLDRGAVALRTAANQVYLSWRMLGTDPAAISFNLYRNGVKINGAPIASTTNYTDTTTTNGSYTIRSVLNGVEQNAVDTTSVWAQNYLDIPLQKPADGISPDGSTYTYNAQDCSVGDLDGDGKYEIILKWDPSNYKDNSQAGITGNVYLDAYKLDGTRLWRIDLGRNIRAGSHYTQFMVYDLDGDGKAELACKTADGTVDGRGLVIGDPIADYRNSSGYVLSGPEFLTIFNGMTGAAMATTNYLPGRGSVAAWGDTYGNRVDRFIAAIAYLDGQKPSLVMGRGYYTRLVRAAWDWRGGQLTLRWLFDSESGTPYNSVFSGQGNHQMTVGDVDGDGKQEVFNGSSGINDNGQGLWANGMGHGDALHMSDLDPDRPGLEIWQPYESPSGNGNVGAALVDARTGERIFTVAEPSADVGRGLAADIDPRYKGYEMWAARGNLYNCKGQTIGAIKPSMNFAIWWDGDLLRELLDGTTIQKWDYLTSTRTNLLSPADVTSNNSTKATPCLSADLLGDWREEVVFRTTDNAHLRIYTTTIPTQYRLYTLMHDPQYRVAIAWQNSGYNQPPHPGFYLGDSMPPAPTPAIYLAGEPAALPVKLLSFDAKAASGKVAISWRTERETNNALFTVERSVNGQDYTPIYNTKGAGTSSNINTYAAMDNAPVTGLNYYRLKQTDQDEHFTYSIVRTVSFTGKENLLTAFPNPATNAVQLQLSSGSAATDLQLLVSSPEGKAMLQAVGSLPQINKVLNARLASFSKGTYIIQVVDQSKTYTTKIIKQ